MRLLTLMLSLLAPAAFATTLIAMDVPALTKSCDAVVRGRVVSVTPRWTEDKARIITDTEIEVLESLKGPARTRVTVMQPGGEVGEVGQLVAGAARFSPGAEVVVFLESRGTRFILAGMAQGKLTVERSTDGRAAFVRGDAEVGAELVDPATRQPTYRAPVSLSLEDLKAQVKAAQQAQPTTVVPGRAPTSGLPVHP